MNLIWEIRLYETFRNRAIVIFKKVPYWCFRLKPWLAQTAVEHPSIWKLVLFKSPLSCLDWIIRLDLRDLLRFISLMVTYLQVLHRLIQVSEDGKSYESLTFLSAEHLASAARSSFGSGLTMVVWIGIGLAGSDGINFDLSKPGNSEIKLDVFELVDSDDFKRVVCIFVRFI